MNRRLLLLCITIALSTLLGRERVAFAQTSGTSFALIVTNNRSTRLSRPDLRYADDDGAKYYELFRMLAPESNVTLLTTFDRDTQKLFPDVVGKEETPSRANLASAARDIAKRVRAAMSAGPVDFYFVYAGHGDIEKGKGFLELADGAFTADDLEALLKGIPATHAHVILDSCNSFFVINSRKPGGRHFVTSAEATTSLSERMPNVGVFLSTSAEAEVFEWSELQSGVFSHAVRSGLSGAADANGDGRVTYDELRAFVHVASKDVKNPNYRPQVFARGPGGRGVDVLVDLTHAQSKRIRIDEAQRRLTVRDQNELPLVDLHKESGQSLTIRIPAHASANASIEERDKDGAVVKRYSLRAHDGAAVVAAEPSEREAPPVMLASLPASAAHAEARGAADMFRTLFAQPFGPEAFDEARKEAATAPPLVLGVSSDERERMRLVLREAADNGRRKRTISGVGFLGAAAGVGTMAGFALESGIRKSEAGDITSGAALGLLSLWWAGHGIKSLVKPSFEEETYEGFSRSLALAPDTTHAQSAYAEAEHRLLSSAERDRRGRVLWQRWLGGVALFGFGAGIVTYRLIEAGGNLDRIENPIGTTFGAGLAAFGVLQFVDSFFPTTTEHLADLWRNDPSVLRTRNNDNASRRIVPMLGLGGVGVSGTF